MEFGEYFGVAASTEAAGDNFTLYTEGTYSLPKDTTEAFLEGDRLYWDNVDLQLSVTEVGPCVGVAAAAAAGAATTGQVALNPCRVGGVKRFVAFLDASAGIAIGDSAFGPTVPAGYRVLRAYYSVDTTFTSATDAATIGIGFDTDDVSGIVAATAISAGGNIWDAGLHEGIQTGTMANMGEELTAARQFEAVIAVEALTDGELALYVDAVRLA